MNREEVQFNTDPQWLAEWKAEYPQLNNQQNPGFLKRSTERVKSGTEALVNRMGQALENTKVFGRSVADFALRKGATGALRYGVKELAKGIWSMSGAAGAAGGVVGGAIGTPLTGAFVGAIGGAAVEYVRQVNRNLNTRLKEVQETDPALVGRKQIFLKKIEGLRHSEVYKPNLRKIGKAALFGAIAGAGAGALTDHLPQLIEFVKEHMGGLESVASKAQDIAGHAAGSIGHTAGEAAGTVGRTASDIVGKAAHLPGVEGAKEMAGTVGRTIGDTAGGIGHAAGEAAGTVGRTAGNLLGDARDMAGNLPGVEKVQDLAGGAKEVAGEAWGTVSHTADNLKHAVGLDKGVHEAVQPQEDFVPQADYDTLNQNLAEANQTIGNLQQQLDEAKQALAAAKETVPVGDITAGAAATATEAGTAATQAAAEQAVTHAQSVLDNFGGSIPLGAGSNPWEVSTDILKQMGVNPTPEQVMQLTTKLAQENSLGVPEWGITGMTDARSLPIGFPLNLTDVVKKTALEIASKK